MKRHHLVILLIMPFLMVSIASYFFWAKKKLLLQHEEFQAVSASFMRLIPEYIQVGGKDAAIKLLSDSLTEKNNGFTNILSVAADAAGNGAHLLIWLAAIQASACFYVFFAIRRKNA